MTLDELSEARAMRKNGHTWVEIGTRFGLTPSTVRKRCGRGTYVAEGKQLPAYTTREDDILRKMIAEGKNYKSIGVALDRTHQSVQRRVQRLGIWYPHPRGGGNRTPGVRDVVHGGKAGVPKNGLQGVDREQALLAANKIACEVHLNDLRQCHTPQRTELVIPSSGRARFSAPSLFNGSGCGSSAALCNEG